MRASAPVLVGLGLVFSCLIVAACTTDYQLGKDDVSYGGPNALQGKQPPGTSIDTSDDGGGTSSGGNTLKCGTQIDGGTCAVSWKTDIIGAWSTANCSSTACHGGPTPINQPSIDTTNATTTWMNLEAFTISTGLPYINPCSVDPTASAIGANMLADPGATGGSHMPQAGQLAQADIDKINMWVICGAPDN